MILTYKLNNEFTYATQYYRAPTPLLSEWEKDFCEMHDNVGIDTVQFRVQWRWNEPREGEYYFDDLDRLFELAAKYHKKVLFKFLMENAPDYVYTRYHGTRCDMHGNYLRPMAHGAYYCGGWLPCFDNPDVIRKAVEFTKAMVDRYKSRSEIVLWNVWNEPIARPIGECGCTHSIISYRNWLKNRYQTIENLNEFFGKRWASFDTIEPPASPLDFAELYLWKLWSLDTVTHRVRFMYDTVKGIDGNRPVITHVGGGSVVQDVAGGGSDDLQNATVVDFYGCSLPTENILDNPINSCWPALQCDWVRSVSEYYWVYELYPDWGAWQPRVRSGDYKLKVMSSLACGAKGITYWQYKAERLGMENNLSGLVNVDGSPKEVSRECAGISDFIKKHEEFLLKSKVVHDSIAIVYSLPSDLISRVENTGSGSFWDFSLRDSSGQGQYLYKKALCGIYAMFRELGYTVDWLDARMLPQCAENYDLLYLPEYYMPTDVEISSLLKYHATGGKIIAEEGAGLRQPNTWINLSWPCKPLQDIFGTKIYDRVLAQFRPDNLNFEGIKLAISLDNYISYFNVDNDITCGTWNNGMTAVAHKDNSVYIGTSFGALFHDTWRNQYDACLEMLSSLLAKLSFPAARVRLPRGTYMRQLAAGDSLMLFLFNINPDPVELSLPGIGKFTPCYGDISVDGDKIIIDGLNTVVCRSNQVGND